MMEIERGASFFSSGSIIEKPTPQTKVQIIPKMVQL
jgi:hypothetical protein